MERNKSLPKMNVFLLIVLSFITLGIFVPIWFLIRKTWLNSLSATKKFGSGLAIFVLIIFCISFLLLFSENPTIELIDNTISLVGGIIILILAFKVRRILIQHFNENLGMNISFSGAGTFFFTIWYLQYKINRLPTSGEILGDVA